MVHVFVVMQEKLKGKNINPAFIHPVMMENNTTDTLIASRFS